MNLKFEDVDIIYHTDGYDEHILEADRNVQYRMLIIKGDWENILKEDRIERDNK